MNPRDAESAEDLDGKIERRIRSVVGGPVRFKYPGGEGRKLGILRDRVVWQSDAAPSGVRYWDVIDLIEFPDESKRLWIRFSYYREDHGRLRWAGQTSLAEPVENMRRLFAKGAAEAAWFREILSDLT